MKVSGMLWKYNIPLNITSRKKKSRKRTEPVKQPKIEGELEYTRTHTVVCRPQVPVHKLNNTLIKITDCCRDYIEG
jgi:hypothetical protein